MNKKTLAFIVVLVILIIGGLFWLNVKNQGEITIQPSESVSEDYSESNKKSSDQSSISDWQIYRNEEFGFEFKYPDSFGNVSLKKYSGTTGDQIQFNFSKGYISLGGITKDYTAARSGSCMDFSGFKKENDNYFWGFVGDVYYPITPKKIINNDILLVDCMSFEDKCNPIGPTLSVSKGNIAGLINLKHNKLKGLIMITNEKYEKLLLQILSTFKFIEN